MANMGSVRIDVSRLPEPLQSMMRTRLAPFEGQPFTFDLRVEIIKAVSEVDSHARVGTMLLRPTPDGPPTTTIVVTVGESGPVQFAAPAPAPAPADFPSSGAQRIVASGAVQQSKLIDQPKPQYPPLARQARIQGTVRFNALIGVDGRVANLTLVSGHPLLVPAAQEVVQQWTYQPTLLNGEPVEVVTQIDVNFTLQ